MHSNMASKPPTNDPSLLLHNKLGSADDLWAPSNIASLLNNVVENLQSSFSGLSTPVKLKLLLGALHFPRCSVDDADDRKRKKESLSAVLRLATEDRDEWVRTVAAILQPFPDTGSLNLDLERKPNPGDLRELRKKVNAKKCGGSSSATMLPLECKYLDQEVREILVGRLAEPVRHFNLKREPKSAALRDELLQKSRAQRLTKTTTTPTPSYVSDRGSARSADHHAATPVKSGGFAKAPAASHNAVTTTSHSGALGAFPGNHGAVPPVPSRTPLLKRGMKLLDISQLRVSAGRETKRRRTMETTPD